MRKINILPLLIAFIFIPYGCSGQNKKTENQDSEEGKVVMVTELAERTFTISPDFNGYNAQMMRGPAWQAPGFIEKVKDLHPGVIRYPGGTVASYWDWKTGLLMENIELRDGWKNIEPKNPIKLEDLKFACDKTGAKPVFVLNMMNSTIGNQMEMLREAKKIGLPVEYVELDNEIYLGEAFYVKKYASGKDYANEANNWIKMIKKEFPGVRIAAVGSSIKEGAAKKEKKYAERTNNWNRDVMSVLKGADALTFHIYGGSGLNYLANKSAGDEDSEVVDDKISTLQSAFDKPGSDSFILGSPFLRWNNASIYDYKILPEGMKAWVTEYNLFEREGVMAGTWIHGLYAVSQTLLFMENPLTELICFHNLTTSAQFAAIFNNDQGFAKAYLKKKNKPFNYTAAGYCLALSGKAMSEGGVANKLKFSNNTMRTAARGQQYPSLNGWIVKGKSGKKIILTNLSNKEATADFTKIISGNATWTQVSSDPRKQIASDTDVTKSNGTGVKIVVPPYSVTLIEGN